MEKSSIARAAASVKKPAATAAKKAAAKPAAAKAATKKPAIKPAAAKAAVKKAAAMPAAAKAAVKKPAAKPAAAKGAVKKPAAKSAAAKATVKKAAAKPAAAKGAAKKPAAKPAAAKKPAAKAAAKKPAAKGAAKKPATRPAAAKAASKKPATRPAAAKAAAKNPATKPVTAKTAAKKPAAKVAASKGASNKPALQKKRSVPSKAPATKTSRAPVSKRRKDVLGEEADGHLAPETGTPIRALDRPRASSNGPARTARDRSQGGQHGLRELDWPAIATSGRAIASKVKRVWDPEIVVGVAKGGVFAGQEISSALGLPFFPVRVHRRSRDSGTGVEAAATMPGELRGHRVLVVDDIAGTGVTLEAAREAALEAGAVEVRTATLAMRKGGYRPDFHDFETSDLVIFAWDYNPSPGAVGGLDDDDASDEELAGVGI
ncbi:phosphoribosyltransferase [Vulgatibacter incomptus]|uniref:Histone protein n=1 Tax=Vulgatibacter incomptus TaxID=1391653 RepID=A0A0K1P843_9BACT|nr:phosphoribosyltransferase family protein [Vulgatibacter incomptus]AKU89677.1 histone protein [Vulgatibacter incomptus]